jgi:putative aldouronate transport system permease protein
MPDAAPLVKESNDAGDWIARLPRKLRLIVHDRWLYVLALPGILYFIVFRYLPIYGVTIAFKDYSIYKGYFESEWVGFANFIKLFGQFGFQRALRNTLIISFYKLVVGFPAPVILALLLNEVTHTLYKKTVQTTLFLPHFISWVIIAGLLYALLSPYSGVVRTVADMLHHEGKIVDLMASKKYFRGVIVVSEVWRNAGFGAIIYIATITTIDPQLYEAATVDGAGRWRQLWHVTLPGIRTTLVILLILRIGRIMNVGFEQIFALYNPMVYEVSEVLETYVYKIGIFEAKYSLATATGFFKSVVGLGLVLLTNTIAKRIDEESGLI